MLGRIEKVIDGMALCACYIAGIGIFIIMLMQVLEIIVRNTLDYSFPFVWEYASYFYICAVFLAAAHTLRVGGHIRVTLLERYHTYLFEVIGTLVALIISLFLSTALIQFSWQYGISGRTSGTVNNVPLVIPAAVMTFGAVLLSAQLVLRLIHALLNIQTERRETLMMTQPSVTE